MSATFSQEIKDIMLAAVKAKSAGGGTPAQIKLATAITTGESNTEVLTLLADEVRG